ncbi:hypothetical protein AVEN_1298-1 [Araneus ventricosus]|uniref:Uncharacterized protein n=1 Tax=Araneus ventricosus TaxID=182803 RepID=A0A4Y2CTP0_ARAVE|nr:hypothetical protein AVEN_1298-1 [Araneus ventricosus]
MHSGKTAHYNRATDGPNEPEGCQKCVENYDSVNLAAYRVLKQINDHRINNCSSIKQADICTAVDSSNGQKVFFPSESCFLLHQTYGWRHIWGEELVYKHLSITCGRLDADRGSLWSGKYFLACFESIHHS